MKYPVAWLFHSKQLPTAVRTVLIVPHKQPKSPDLQQIKDSSPLSNVPMPTQHYMRMLMLAARTNLYIYTTPCNKLSVLHRLFVTNCDCWRHFNQTIHITATIVKKNRIQFRLCTTIHIFMYVHDFSHTPLYYISHF